MKKIYTLALAAAMAGFSANADSFQLRDGFTGQKASHSIQFQKKGMDANFDRANTTSVKRAAEQQTIEGTYDIYIGDYYFDDSVGQVQDEATITYDSSKGQITIQCSYFPTGATIALYDEDAHEITFGNVTFGQMDFGTAKYYVAFLPGKYTEVDGKGQLNPQQITVPFDPATGVITFEADTFFSWYAFSDANYSTAVGPLDIFDVLGMEKQPEVEIDEEQAGQWTDLGDATMIDAWVLASYSVSNVPVVPSEYPFTVKLQQNNDNKNLLRLWAPYHSESFMVASLNSSKYQGQIVFDVTDPDFVEFKPGYPAGFNNGNGEMYCYDLLGWQIWGYGDDYNADRDYAGIIEFMVENDQPFSTMVEVGDDYKVTVELSGFDTSSKCTKFYTWNNAASYVSEIVFPKTYLDQTGVSEISEISSEAPAAYYNLQGVRVANPEAGQLVIRVQGNKAVKEIVK